MLQGIGRQGYVDPFSRWDAMQAVELKSNKTDASKKVDQDDADDQIRINMKKSKIAVEADRSS